VPSVRAAARREQLDQRRAELERAAAAPARDEPVPEAMPQDGAAAREEVALQALIVSSAPPSRDPVRAPLDDALAEQLQLLDRVHARVWQIVSAAGIVLGVAVWILVRGDLGSLAAISSAAFLIWFTVQGSLLRRGVRGPAVAAATVAEGLAPWIFLAVVTVAQGPTYALGSWVPPLLFAALILTSTARLRPWAPIVIAAVGALLFLAMYATFLRPRLGEGERAMPLFGWTMQITRALSMMLGGLIAAMVTRALRGAIGRAERSVRERELFGKYQLESKIASGGMGVVHRARYCPEGGFVRNVAIKLLHPHLAEQEAFLEAFRTEAAICARLVHPNVVQVLDFGKAGEAYFLAMELVDGLTLATLLRHLSAAKRPLPEELAYAIVHALLEGLDYTHARARDSEGRLMRIVHRDLCPANILVSRSGEVKLTDFGIARALRDADSSQTRTVAGHVGYMAPEQARAGVLDERTDLFAAGAILWELLAGEPLFDRSGEAQSLLALLACEVPSIRERRPDVRAEWDAVVRGAVQRTLDDRFASARAMSRALDVAWPSPASEATAALAELVEWALAQPPPPPRTYGGGNEAETLPLEEREAATLVEPARPMTE
jgi:serine/threonine protein kinase